MKKVLVFCVSIFITITLKAQMNEIGPFVGGSNYIGDVGSTTYINPKDLSFGIIYKLNLSSRFAARATFTHVKYSADNANASSPKKKNIPFKFNNNLNEVAIGIEFNFFKYNLNQFKFMHSPYVFINLAYLSYKAPKYQTGPSINTIIRAKKLSLPFGIGYKIKLLHRLGMSIETRFNYTGKDNLEGNQTIINKLNFNNPNNKDWIVTTGVSIVYAFGKRTCYFNDF